MLKLNSKNDLDCTDKNIIRCYFYIGALLPMILLVLFFSFTYMNSLEKELSTKIDQLSTSIIKEKKLFIRNAVERTFFLIESVRAQVLSDKLQKNLTQAQIKSISIDRISNFIRNVRLANNGYIWVNHILDYQGGDKYAVRRVHPNMPDSEGLLLSTNMLDIHGNKPYETELNGINQNGEIYFEYYFNKMDSLKVAHKMSFAKLYKPYDWVIASGVYLDDVDLLIERETKKMQEIHNKQKKYAFFLSLGASLISIVMIIFFEKKIRKLILSYEQKINKYTKKLEIRSITDGLTGLYNRLKLDSVFVSELWRAARYKTPLSIIMIDLDHFKNVNDTYGHLIGDQVIREVATILKDNTRSVDTVGRWGGEEFLIICSENELKGAKQLADKIRKRIELHNFPAIGSVTCSFGISTFHDGDSQDSMMERADKALYRAKKNGRNTTVCAEL